MYASCYFIVFFLMIRRPPRSTLFPTRRSSDLAHPRGRHTGRRTGGGGPDRHRGHHGDDLAHAERAVQPAHRRFDRSEEHTSELQSQSNLVCRLLLEKKNKKKKNKKDNKRINKK